MSLQLPQLKLVQRNLPPCNGLPDSCETSLEILNTISSGSFGLVKLCKKNGETFVWKELMEDDKELDKLTSFMNRLDHGNIVKFNSIIRCSNEKCAFLMEYVFFDFSFFGEEKKISSLTDFLQYLDQKNFFGFEHLSECVAKDISNGLTFLHDNDVVHRDLKPDNVLISNGHYTQDTMMDFWKKKPIIAKLGDFGESRSKLSQTSSLSNTLTENLKRGTPFYMAPELYEYSAFPMNLETLKICDVWSMSMIFFMLINPNLRYPYQAEISEIRRSDTAGKDIIEQVFQKKKLPEHNEKYSVQRNEFEPWQRIQRAFYFSARLEWRSRPTAREVSALFEKIQNNKTSNRNLSSDFQRDHSNEKLEESLCEKVIPEDSSSMNHQGSDTVEKTHKCGSILDNPQTHMRTHTEGKQFHCDVCGYSTSCLSKLKLHQRTHTGQKPYKCDMFGYSATRMDAVKTHQMTHKGEKLYKCDECNLSDTQMSILQRHQRTHTGNKPYKCDECGYSTTRLGHLKVHQRTHTGEKPYKCDKCEYSASRLHHLKAHQRTHTGDKPYKCDECGFSTSHLCNLKTHQRTHTGDKPYKCDECQYRSPQLSALKKHKRTHTRKKCDYSGYSATQLVQRTQNKKNHSCVSSVDIVLLN